MKALMHKAVSASHLREEKDLKKTLDSALLKGENLNKGVKADEVAWIAAGKDVAAEFQSKYLQVRK
ncbi:hypothetical protein [Verrucomicrobium sp. BvORR034]|uniref:hypothetical protein n=1 Tax=Verrucomicrobium sp. BvORR034 TaxID=1396418 RepID=UPI002240F59E|nr:hypothetical protein [Verrucomicrobium sp. BvORR034]